MRDREQGSETRGDTHNSIQGGTVIGSVYQAQTISMQPMPYIMPGAPAPRSLPATTAFFVNRRRELDALAAKLQQPDAAPRVVVLHGEGGIGKTVMALQVASRLDGRFPDGELYADLRGSSAAAAATPSDVLNRFLLMLKVNPQFAPRDLDAQLDLYRSLVAGRRLFVLLDDALSAAQVKPLLAATQGSLTVVTSRFALPGLVQEFGAHSVRLGAFEAADAIRLLARVSGLDDVGGNGEPERDVIEAVARRCAGLPLALCTAAARMVTQPDLTWSRLEHDLSDSESDQTGDGDGAPEPDLLGAYADLSPAAVRLHGLLAVHSWPYFDADIAQPALLAELRGARLTEDLGNGRFRLHDRVAEQAQRLALARIGQRERSSGVRDLVSQHLRFAVAASLGVIGQRWTLGPVFDALEDEPCTYPDAATAQAALADRRESLVEAVIAADEFGFDDLVWQLCEALWGLFLRLGFCDDWVRTHTLGVAAAVRLGDLRAEGRMRCQLAFGYMGLARFADAEEQLVAAASADARAGHERGRATAAESLGLLRLKQNRPNDAVICFEEARTLAAAVGDPRAIALLEHHLGRALSAGDRHDRALEQLEHARELMENLADPDPYNVGRVTTSIGEALIAAGRVAEAAGVLAEAAETMERQRATLQQAAVAELRAQCAREMNDPSMERRFLEQALGFHMQTGSPRVGVVSRRLEELRARD